MSVLIIVRIEARLNKFMHADLFEGTVKLQAVEYSNSWIPVLLEPSLSRRPDYVPSFVVYTTVQIRVHYCTSSPQLNREWLCMMLYGRDHIINSSVRIT